MSGTNSKLKQAAKDKDGQTAMGKLPNMPTNKVVMLAAKHVPFKPQSIGIPETANISAFTIITYDKVKNVTKPTKFYI